MDPVELDLTRQKAGSEYLIALRKLGLRPDALFWVFDKVESRFVLMLATEMVDFKGPLAIAELLFQAYNAAATPQAIDPFVVRLHSPDHTIIRFFDGWKKMSDIKVSSPNHPDMAPVSPTAVTQGDVEFREEWVYRFALPPERNSVDLSRRWKRFAHNVERLAA